jgi:hypothetical protein
MDAYKSKYCKGILKHTTSYPSKWYQVTLSLIRLDEEDAKKQVGKLLRDADQHQIGAVCPDPSRGD